MVWKQYCDMCGLEIPHITEDFCLEEMAHLAVQGNFEQSRHGETLFEIDTCHACTRVIKDYILDLMKPQSLQGKVNE